MSEKEFMHEIVQSIMIRFVLTAVLTTISAVVWGGIDRDKVIDQRPSIWQSFTCAPLFVKGVVIWILIGVGFNIWGCISAGRNITNASIIGMVIMLSLWLLMSCCILKGHRWPRNLFLIAGTLGVAGGILERMTNAAHEWTGFSVNLTLNGALVLILYALLATNESVKWRDAIREAKTEAKSS